MLKAPIVAHAMIERILPCVPEGRVPEIMRQRNRLGQILMQTQGSGDTARQLRHFDAMREPGAKEVTLVVYKYLRFIFEASKRR